MPSYDEEQEKEFFKVLQHAYFLTCTVCCFTILLNTLYCTVILLILHGDYRDRHFHSPFIIYSLCNSRDINIKETITMDVFHSIITSE